MYRVRHKNNRLRKLKFLENDKAYFCIFSSVSVKVHVCKMRKFLLRYCIYTMWIN